MSDENKNVGNEKFDRVFYGGIIVGLIVFIAGILSSYWRITGLSESRLILCAGLGFLMGTFGSTGVVKYRNITITGVAAIAIILAYVVVRQSADISKFITLGTITGDIKGTSIDIRGDDPLFGAMRDKGERYSFVVERPINRPVFDLIITIPKNPLGGDEGAEIPFERIDSKFINSVIGSGEKIEWRFNRKKETIEDYKGNIIARLELPKISFSQRPGEQADWLDVKKALAQDSNRSLQDNFIDLASGSNEVRRAARSDLAARGPNAVSAMMQEFRNHQNIYQVRLGILVAMTEMLRNNKQLAPQISQQLSKDDLQLIVGALSDNDRTIRIYAGEFLYDLGDPRVAPLALQSAKIENSEEGRYLSVFAIKGAYPKLSESQKVAIREQLEAIIPTSGDKTKELINSLTINLPKITFNKDINGLDYADQKISINNRTFHITIIRVDLKTRSIKIISPKSFSPPISNLPRYNIKQYFNFSKSRAIISGGYFSSYQPALPFGFVKINNNIISSLFEGSVFNGIFCSNGHRVIIDYYKNVNFEEWPDCLQAGPILIREGKELIEKLPKEILDIKTQNFLGNDANNNIYLGFTEGIGLSDLSKYLVLDNDNGGIGCVNALRLSGEIASGIIIRRKNKEPIVSGNKNVLLPHVIDVR